MTLRRRMRDISTVTTAALLCATAGTASAKTNLTIGSATPTYEVVLDSEDIGSEIADAKIVVTPVLAGAAGAAAGAFAVGFAVGFVTCLINPEKSATPEAHATLRAAGFSEELLD